jgi:hypothetical protein
MYAKKETKKKQKKKQPRIIFEPKYLRYKLSEEVKRQEIKYVK